MAVGFNLKYNKGSWRTISNPKFVFTSPNMDDQSPAGTRSHIVAGEIEVGTWLEDSALNKMWKLAHAQDESLTWETNIHEYQYTDYRPERVKVAAKATTPFSKVYLSERPSQRIYTAEELNDDFTGNNGDSPNTDLWSGTGIISSNKLYLDNTNTRSNFRLVGDFDIQVDFSGITFPAENSWGLRFFVGGSDGTKYNIRLEYSSSSKKYHSFRDGTQGYLEDAVVGTSDTSGKFRITRVGDIFKGYRWTGSAWSQVGTGLTINYMGSIQVGFVQTDWDTSPFMDGTFDNFKVNSGTPANRWFPNPTISDNSFEATRITHSGSNWWKLDEIWASYPDFADSLGNFDLVSSGGVVPLWHWYGVGYVAEFDGSGDSLIYSNNVFSLDDEFCVSFYVDSYGTTSTGTDSFGYNSTFFNVVTGATYFSIGCSENDTITYSIKTDVAEYKSDTGSTLSSGTFNNIVVSYKQTDGLYIYKDNNLIVYNTSVTGTVGSGNLCIGNTAFGYSSTFRGCISDVKCWDNYLCSDDVNEIATAGQLQDYPICMFGSSVGDYIVNVGVAGPTVIDHGLFYGFPTYISDSHFTDTLHLWMTLGEAYNCYLTAWDDSTHSSTANTVLENELCKITACVYRSSDANANGLPDHNQNDTTYPPVHDYVSDYPIKGNELYYGKFNLVYYVREPLVMGDMVSVRPRISTINSDIFDPGNYDFVITFHYQYT